MTSSRENEHFALDWIKSDLLETLNEARVALDDYVEQGGDETRLRSCLTSLHQLHGTLLMLELEGVTLLADHLEQAAQKLMNGDVEDSGATSQVLMQGILEMPGHLDELQRGVEDKVGVFIPLVNDIRTQLAIDPMEDTAGKSLNVGATDDSVEHFKRLDGQARVTRMRSAYQTGLLSILKGDDRTTALQTLGKISAGLQKLTMGSSMERQWQAFGEFLNSLAGKGGVLESGAVKLLRRVDIEIKGLAGEGENALKRPANLELIQNLLDATDSEDYQSETVAGLREAVERDGNHNTLAISGRQALATAAVALRDELAVIKDKLDLLARASSFDLNALRDLTGPLKKIGSTLSLLGFESSKTIVADQIEGIENLVVLGDADPAGIQSIAAALVQIDENLNSVSNERSEIEQITSEAQLQVLREAGKGLELVKAAVVDFVTAHWDVRHLQTVPGTFREICGALEIIPLPRVTQLLEQVNDFVESRLIAGYQPDWQELDQFADVVSGIDYYLERLAEENIAGMDDILQVAERSLQSLNVPPPVEEAADAMQTTAVDVPVEVEEIVAADEILSSELVPSEPSSPLPLSIEPLSLEPLSVEPADSEAEANPPDAGTIIEEADLTEADSNPDDAASRIFNAADLTFGGIPETQQTNIEEPAEEGEEILLQMEEDVAFDLNSKMFEDLEGVVETAPEQNNQLSTSPFDVDLEAAAEAEVESEIAANIEAKKLVFEGEPRDPEIVEIFVEEVGEVLESIDEWLPQWAVNFEVGEPLAEVRRAFHTLKGSGRIVQAVEIGELAWGIENMLNRIIDGTVTPNDQFVKVIGLGRDLVPSLIDSFEACLRGDLDAISNIIEQADLLASGGTLPDEAAIVKAPSLEAADEVDAVDTIAPYSSDVLQSPEIISESEHQFEPEIETEAEPSEAEVAHALFVSEVEEHLIALDEAQSANPWQLSESLSRALHTLAGCAATAAAEEVLFVVKPANQVVDIYRDQPASEELQEFFGLVTVGLRQALENLGNPEWDAPVEVVARADDLVMQGLTKTSPLEELLSSEATGLLFANEPALDQILKGETEATELLGGFIDFVAHARQLEDGSVAELAASLMQAVTIATIAGGIGISARNQVGQGYSALIEQLNALVVGEAPVSADETIQMLQDINFEAPDPEGIESEEIVSEKAASEEAEPVVEMMGEMSEDTPSKESSPEIPNLADLDIDEDLVEVFFEEADEINEGLETTILSWSHEMDNRIYLESILRGLHTLKGGARLCGLTHIGDMTHDFESMVIEVQNNQRAIDTTLFKDLHERYDAVVGQLAHVRRALFETEEIAETESAKVIPLPSQALLDATTPIDEPLRAEPGFGLGATPTEPIVGVTDVTRDEPAMLQAAQAKTVPTEKVERPAQEMVRVGAHLLEELVNLAGENSILRARVERGMSDFTGALDEMETTIERLREQLRRLGIETETQVLFRAERDEGPAYENFDPLEMDRYSQLQQLSRSLSESASDMLDLKDTLLFKARESEALLLQQARINTELQEGLMRTRMVPFNRLMPRLRRIVRQVAVELDKAVDFHVQNAVGELDRNLLERMIPPLEHMLRNAVDHGVEVAEVRRNFGKAATGRIDLRLSREGGDVVIEIADDGAGIEVESVREKALEKGLCTRDSVLSDEEVMQFILAPGFSTAKAVTQISGRGVGMDVVHSEVKQLGGSIHISSRVGKGTRFVLRVPFTVSVNRALMVSVSDDLYAIPLNTIEGIVLLSPEKLERMRASDDANFEYAGVPYRMRYLGQYLGREYHGAQVGQTSVPVVLVRSGDHAVAIHVDAVQGSREIVVKSLGPQFAGVGGISGATILGDGSVVVILDLHALIRAQRQVGQQSNSTKVGLDRPRCILVVDDSVTVRKVTSRLLERQGMDVLLAKDGVEAVALLQERRPDVMLLDIEMPRMDGFEVARQVRHDDRLVSLPIVIISSRTGDKHKEHASQLGVNKFLGKPFQENELLATIDELVTRM
jgi:chemosensory pili system protein ChpA (sensor histidine kinase/response regulator)